MEKTKNYLGALLQTLQKRGRYVLTKKEALSEIGCAPKSVSQQANRLFKKKTLFMPKRGFWVAVPPEYQEQGVVPPPWYIHDLMDFERTSYYVGLLSAASLHGAAHQKPQTFQVIVGKQLRPIGSQVIFFKKSQLSTQCVQTIKTMTGYMNVSSPALTAFDLVRYPEASGYLSHVATILMELTEVVTKKDLKAMLASENNIPTSQRLGFLLEKVGNQELAEVVHKWLHPQKKKDIPLMVRSKRKEGILDSKWGIIVNEDVEADL